MLERAGVDVARPRPDRPAAVVRPSTSTSAARARGRGSAGEADARGRRPLAETVLPLGPPPDDEDDARAQIAEAVTGIAPDDRALAGRIERGQLLDDLDPVHRQPPDALRGQTVTVALLDVVFLREDEAIIEFEIRMSGGGRIPMPGRAVRRDGRWLVSYDTIANLRKMGGQSVPSLLDHPEGHDETPAEDGA